MNFSQALDEIKRGNRLARTSWNRLARPDWNAQYMRFVYLVDGSTFSVSRAPLDRIFPQGTEIVYRPHIDIRSHDQCGVWFPSMEDILAEDWYLI